MICYTIGFLLENKFFLSKVNFDLEALAMKVKVNKIYQVAFDVPQGVWYLVIKSGGSSEHNHPPKDTIKLHFYDMI